MQNEIVVEDLDCFAVLRLDLVLKTLQLCTDLLGCDFCAHVGLPADSVIEQFDSSDSSCLFFGHGSSWMNAGIRI